MADLLVGGDPLLTWPSGSPGGSRRGGRALAGSSGRGLGLIGLYGDGCQQSPHRSGLGASSCAGLTQQTPGAAAAFVAHLPTELTHLPRSYDGRVSPTRRSLTWRERPPPGLLATSTRFRFRTGTGGSAQPALWEAYRGRRKAVLVAAGVGAAALPWFNPFGFLVIALVGLWWLGRRGWWRGLACYLVPLLLLGLPRMLYLVAGRR